jgi:septal ring factor EnvC (AmiA/AmiB activator)
MKKCLLFSIAMTLAALSIFAQPPSREELEKQRQQLKAEIEETERMLSNNKAQTKESMLQYNLISRKVNLQDKVIDNINKDLNVLDDNMYLISRDIYRYDKLLDTLKQEYAKSMVYAYKNRSSYDFLNFIFSSSNFNDAIKRISYLKSYRTYREMQGDNILRTQDLRKNRMVDLNSAKQVKKGVLEVQSKEMKELEKQKQEKDRIVAELKKQGKQLNSAIAAKKKQMQKVNSAIAAAIKKALEDARKEAIAKANAEKERLRKLAEANVKSGTSTEKSTTSSSKVTVPDKPVTAVKRESVLLNDDNIALNNNFEKNRGALPWPVDRGIITGHYGVNTLATGTLMDQTCVTISSEVGNSVKAVFEGMVSQVKQIDYMTVVTIQHGKYFTTYSNLTDVGVKKGQNVKTGQVIGKVALNLDREGSVDFYICNETINYDPEKWLRRR